MAQSPIPEIDLAEIMEKIGKEVAKSRPVSGAPQKEVAKSRPVSDAPQKMAAVASRMLPREPGGVGLGDRILWKFGMRYSKLINRVPLLRKIAEKHYVRIVSILTDQDRVLEGVREEVKELAKQVNEHERTLLNHERRLTLFLEEARSRATRKRRSERD